MYILNDRCIFLCATVCSGEQASITENNEVGAVVTTIQTINEAITLTLLDPTNIFSIAGKQLIAAVVLDYEV